MAFEIFRLCFSAYAALFGISVHIVAVIYVEILARVGLGPLYPFFGLSVISVQGVEAPTLQKIGCVTIFAQGDLAHG